MIMGTWTLQVMRTKYEEVLQELVIATLTGPKRKTQLYSFLQLGIES